MIGRDLIGDGGDVTVKFKDRVIGARDGRGKAGTLVTKSSARVGKPFALVDKSVAGYASGGRGDVALDPNESLETFLSSSGSMHDEGIHLVGLRLGSEVVLEEPMVGHASGEGPSSEFRPPYLGS